MVEKLTKKKKRDEGREGRVLYTFEERESVHGMGRLKDDATGFPKKRVNSENAFKVM